MASRQDQMQSYQFTMSRVVAALVSHDTDPAAAPTRRLATAVLVGILAATLSLAGTAVYGMLVPGGSDAWRDPSAIIVEKETGARYVYLDGSLHPVLNYTSALLVVGSSQAHTVSVSRRSLAGVPRGATLGIAGAPDSLPAPDHLLTGGWTVCSTGGAATLHVAASVPGHDLAGDEGLLVEVGDTVWLLWHGHRHRVTSFALGALAWRAITPVPVAPALVDAIPAGPDLARIPLPGRGGRSAAGYPVGRVFVVRPQGGSPQYVVAVPDGLAAISQVQANLLLGDPDTARVQGASGAIDLDPASYTAAPVAAALTPPPGDLAPPATMPRLARPAEPADGVCATISDPGGLATVRTGVTTPAGSAASGRTGVRPVVPAGRGALVEAMSSAGAVHGTLCLVTDVGIRFVVPDSDVAGMLGYAGVEPVRLPSSLVALIPEGPALDPDAARTPVRPPAPPV